MKMFKNLQYRRELRKELEDLEITMARITDLKRLYSLDSEFYGTLKKEYDRLWDRRKDLEFELA